MVTELLSIHNITSWILLGVVTLIIYTLLFAPAAPEGARGTASTTDQRTTSTTNHPTSTNRRDTGLHHNKTPCSRSPDHLVTKPFNNGSNVLNDGLIGFLHCQACQQQQVPEEPSLRKRRIQWLSRLLDTRPPSKGSIVTIAVDDRHLDCPFQKEAIQVLAAYYNVLVIVAVSNNDVVIQKKSLQSSVLPAHRILLASTVAGRVAMVRQLQRVELVLEFDANARDLLTRFGHKVVVYGENGSESRFARLWKDGETASNE